MSNVAGGSEDIRRIDFARHMFDQQKLGLDPLANRVFPKFNMMSCFRGHVVGPFNTRIVVIVEEGGGRNIRKIMPRVNHALANVAKVNHLFGGSISGVAQISASQELRDVCS